MFEAAEVGNKIDKATYKEEEPQLRAALLEIQRELAESRRPVLIIIGGVEGAGKEETVNLFLEWLDSRGIEVHAPWDTTDEERERPRLWRYWRALPPSGKIGIMFGSWYTGPIVERVYGETGDVELERELHQIVQLERMLTNEGVVIVKFWMHLAKSAQEKYLKKLKKNPQTAWRITALTWKYFKKYDKFVSVAEEALRRTSTGFAPWQIVEANDPRYRSLTVVKSVLAAIRAALDEETARSKGKPHNLELPEPERFNIIRHLDLGVTMAKGDYAKKLVKYSAKLNYLTRQMHEARRSMILVFEGPDAAGKGGAIRRLTQAMDARNYQVVSVAAPTDEEAAHPYLWRFWRHLPRQGRTMIYDRSWYGRVLVERIEGFCTPEEWQRAYPETNQFEEQLTDFGMIVLKFWLAISADEQLQRFQDRKLTAYKQYKLTEEDWRNRDKWGAYEAAACDMIQRTSTIKAPWVLVEANDKRWARIKVLRTVCEHLEKHLNAKDQQTAATGG
jgi:polyphosphate:AMP phosphotransferase